MGSLAWQALHCRASATGTQLSVDDVEQATVATPARRARSSAELFLRRHGLRVA